MFRGGAGELVRFVDGEGGERAGLVGWLVKRRKGGEKEGKKERRKEGKEGGRGRTYLFSLSSWLL